VLPASAVLPAIFTQFEIFFPNERVFHAPGK
jgi:hypothetical protein